MCTGSNAHRVTNWSFLVLIVSQVTQEKALKVFPQ